MHNELDNLISQEKKNFDEIIDKYNLETDKFNKELSNEEKTRDDLLIRLRNLLNLIKDPHLVTYINEYLKDGACQEVTADFASFSYYLEQLMETTISNEVNYSYYFGQRRVRLLMEQYFAVRELIKTTAINNIYEIKAQISSIQKKYSKEALSRLNLLKEKVKTLASKEAELLINEIERGA